MIFFPYVLMEVFVFSIGSSALLLSSIILINIPAVFILNYFSKIYQERKIIGILLGVSLFSCIMICILLQTNFYAFYFFFLVVFISSILIENLNFALLAKIVPEQYFSKGFLNSGMILI